MRRFWILAIAFLILFVGGEKQLFAQKLVSVPTLSARVTDQTGTLTAQQVSSLEQQLNVLQQTKGSQVAVLIVPTTKPEAIEQFSIRVVENWKLGRKGVDDGVLLLIAKRDRRLRIEVGYGLEGSLTDLIAKRIIDSIITPYFKRGEFYDGIQAGVDAITKVIEGEPLPPPRYSEKNSPPPMEGTVLLLCMVFGFISVQGLRALGFNRFLAALIPASVGGFAIWIFLNLAAGLVMFFILLLIFSTSAYGGRGGRNWGSGGGWSSGGGGFSGGGGSFGGGGASGGW